MTPEDAIAGLAPIVGGGGFAGIVIAYLGYRSELLKGRRGEAVGPGRSPVRAGDPDGLAMAIAQLARAVARMNRLAEFRLGRTGAAEFRAWLDERETPRRTEET